MSDKKKAPGSEKSREGVLAEREAKKLAKIAAKKQKSQPQKGQAPVPPQVETPVRPTVATEQIQVPKTVEPPASGDSQNKSREDVIADRAAKKAAKQKSKKEVKEGPSEVLKPKKEVPALQSIENKREEAASVPDSAENAGEKSKSQLRAERRAKQEAQRAKKAEETANVTKKIEAVITNKKEKNEVVKKEPAATKPKKITAAALDASHRVKLFAHLYAQTDLKSSVLLGLENVHPSISWLGAQYRTRVICGSNVRCLALLSALKRVIADYKPSLKEDVSRGLDAELTRIMAFLQRCRPLAVSMTNAVKHLKQQVRHTHGPEPEAKEELLDWIETYVKDQVEKAAEAISISVRGKISDGDVILTYSCSSLVEKILIAACKEGIRFRVVVVDGRPWLEGRQMLRRLLLAGIHCTYILVNAISFVMPEVTKILLGAHALLANGYVMSRSGASQVALLGRAMNVPVLVCCETHKFSERVQTDSFVYNELGNPDELLCKSLPSVTPLNLVYDVTPPDLVSAVVTELAILPCTSVPVILRIK